MNLNILKKDNWAFHYGSSHKILIWQINSDILQVFIITEHIDFSTISSAGPSGVPSVRRQIEKISGNNLLYVHLFSMWPQYRTL